MKRSTTILLLTLSGIAVTVVVVGKVLHVRQPEPPANVLDDSEIESMTAEVFKSEGIGIKAVPPTAVPAEYLPKVMNILRPAVRNKYPHQWDESSTIGNLTIQRHDGSLIQVTFPFAGQNPLRFTADGVQYMRGGKYEPVLNIVSNGIRLGYGDESLMLVSLIREIHLEQVSGKKSGHLDDVLGDLERSAGNRPPR